MTAREDKLDAVAAELLDDRYLDTTSGRVPSFVNEVIDCGALLGHVEAALAVVDRMNAKRDGAVTAETRRLLAHIAAEVDQRIGDLIEGDPLDREGFSLTSGRSTSSNEEDVVSGERHVHCVGVRPRLVAVLRPRLPR